MPRKPVRTNTLIADLAEPPTSVHRRDICRFAEIITEQPEEEREALTAAVNNPRWKARTLTTVLAKNGIKVSASAILNHRNAVCPCYRNEEK